MSQWQPIETAPNADTKPWVRVLVFNPNSREPIDVVIADGDWWRSRKASGPSGYPTHWMPLPPAPDAEP